VLSAICRQHQFFVKSNGKGFLTLKSFSLVVIIFILVALSACKSDDQNLSNAAGEKEQIYTFTGVLQKKVEYPKTLSEYSYFILTPDANDSDAGHTVILFNEDKLSVGFENYTDRRVEVSGNLILGYIGWRKTLKKGLLVKEIRIIE
jgi:hypothetical protein